MLQCRSDNPRGKIAFLFSSNVIEDFLDSIGLSLDDWCERMTGAWCFGYIDALRSTGWETTLFLVSRSVERPTYRQHVPSGTRICILPVWKLYHSFARGGMARPYGGSVEGVFDRAEGVAWRLHLRIREEIASYLSTPLAALVRHMKGQGCTMILTQEYELARFDLCALLGSLLRIPVYATFQGGVGRRGPAQLFIRPAALRAARGLIIGAESEAHRVIQRYGIAKEKIWQIPNPVDLDVWQPMDRAEARRSLGLPLDAKIVISHGRIDIRTKGLDVLLKAWERIRADRSREDIRLLLIGSGPDDAVLRELLGQSTLTGIKWVDRFEIDRSAMRYYLCAADVYVLASRHEGFPVAPLEAMACGLPIVGTDIPAMKNILEQGVASGGLRVPREDPSGLAEAILSLLDNPDQRRELGQSARRNVAARFSVDAIGRQLDEMFSGSGFPVQPDK